ncbi:hypothetical protein KW795_01110 [Candidatus Microgenomates bacterium]|nr:hypothetical protein [Candidatus Microgenomates bacterium]
MAQINLLPTDVSVSKDVLKAANILKNLAIAGSFLLIILATGGILTLFLLTTQSTNEQKRADALKTEIKSIEIVEQKYFLVKDRLTKANTIIKNRTNEPKIDNLKNLTQTLPEGVTIFDSEVGLSLTKVTINATQSVGLTTFLSSLITNPSYKEMTMKGFSFNPNTGYFVILELK